MVVRIAIILLTALLPVLVFAQTPPANQRLLSAQDIQDNTTCPRCEVGDHVISNGILDLYIGGSHRRDQSFYRFPTADTFGGIIGMAPSGSKMNGDVMLGGVYLRQHNTTRHLSFENVQVTPTDMGATVVTSGSFTTEKGEVLHFQANTVLAKGADKVEVSLTLTNTGSEQIYDLIYALYFDPHQMYDFSPADGNLHPELIFRGYPRENHLIVWNDKTARQIYSNDFLFGWDGGMILPDPLAVDIAPGESNSRHYSLILASTPAASLKQAYETSGLKTYPAHLDIGSHSSGYYEIVVRNAETSAVFFRSFFDRPAPLDIELPEGSYIAEANFFPGNAQCQLAISPSKASDCTLQGPKLGNLTLSLVDDLGAPVPGKITITGTENTSTPRLRPVNPTRRDGYWESNKNSVFPVLSQTTISLPEGTYLLSASRGPEYSLDQRPVTISQQQNSSAELQISRIFDRPDLTSVDSHLHTLQSDGAVSVSEKIVALVASGLNVAIATDHNFPADYQSALNDLGLQDYLTVVTGAEVTVPERLDYNTYPMSINMAAPNHGAIDAYSGDVGSRFQLSRKRDPNVILQVNHPRFWQFDYFNWFGLDPETAAFAYEGFELNFDVLEVVNGAIYSGPENIAARKDWFNLLRRGYFFPLVGSSDSHEIDQDEPGFSRTYVYNDKSSSIRSIEGLMTGIREGRSFASNGPILDLSLGDNSKPGDTVAAKDGVVNIDIDVWTVDWIKADVLTLYVNGEAQKISSDVLVHTTTKPGLHHIKAQLQINLAKDAFIVAEVTGSSDLFPMIQARGSAPDEQVQVLPFALTNPIFVDVDGNGAYNSPLPHSITLLPNPRTAPKH